MKTKESSSTAQQSPAPLAGARSDLAGKRYVNLLRCSNLTQADTSPEGQKRINDAFGSLNGTTWVDDVYAEGVSGSQTLNRDDIQEVLDLHPKAPFDVVIVHDLSRLTRGGIRHGNVVEDTFRKAGIRLVSSTNLIPDGPEGDLIKSVKHYANQLQARSISLAVARGLAQSLAKNARPAAGRNPYALDWLYIGGDGKERMLVRWDGPVQLWLKPGTLEEVGRRVRPPRPPRPQQCTPEERRRRRRACRQARFKGYTKQADETSRLVPGSKERLEVLAWMFSAYFLWGWGYHRIAHDLNGRKIPSPEGSQWSLKAVRSILFNPIYLGVEVRHRWTEALYNKLSENGPVAVVVDQDQLEKEKRTTVPHVERPRDEWRLVDVPHLKDILPSPLREIAAERIMRQFDPDIPPHPKKGKPLHTGEAKHKHLDSPFLLTNILHSKQTGHWMRGETVKKTLLCGPRDYRYYFDGGAAVHAERGLNVRRIPAEPVEKAVLDVVAQVLSDHDGIAERVRASASKLSTEQPDDGQRREALLAEKERITVRMRQAYHALGTGGMDAIAEELAKDQRRLAEIKSELQRMERATAAPALDVEQAVQNVTERLRHVREHLRELSNAQMKQFVAAVVEDLQIDLASGELSFTIVLPEWMAAAAPEASEEAKGEVRLDWQLPWP